MAIYEYRCLNCQRTFTRMESVAEQGKTAVTCPQCRSTRVERVYSSFYAKTVRKS